VDAQAAIAGQVFQSIPWLKSTLFDQGRDGLRLKYVPLQV